MVNAQTLGVILAAVGATLLWSAWALVIAGVVLVVVPELVAVARRRAARRAIGGRR